MGQKMIPFLLLMRGGTSRGAYFLKEHLPWDRAALNRVFLKVMGSPDTLQMDVVGGATTTTTNVDVAGEMMGLGDVAGRAIPKLAMVAEARRHGNLTARYLVPTTTHPSMAVTGGLAISCCSLLQGTVPHEVAAPPHVLGAHTHHVIVEHPSGEIPLVFKATQQAGCAPELGHLDVRRARALRTARLLFPGMVRVPSTVGLETFTQPAEYRQMSDQLSQLYRPRQKPLKLLLNVA